MGKARSYLPASSYTTKRNFLQRSHPDHPKESQAEMVSSVIESKIFRSVLFLYCSKIFSNSSFNAEGHEMSGKIAKSIGKATKLLKVTLNSLLN